MKRQTHWERELDIVLDVLGDNRAAVWERGYPGAWGYAPQRGYDDPHRDERVEYFEHLPRRWAYAR